MGDQGTKLIIISGDVNMENSKTPYIIGLIIGVAALFLIFRRNNDMQMQMQQSQIGVQNWKSLDIPNFDDVYSKMIQPVAVSQSVEQNVENTEQKVEQIDNNSTQYKNKEVWKIARNQDGDIETIEVERNAKVS